MNTFCKYPDGQDQTKSDLPENLSFCNYLLETKTVIVFG